MRVKLLHVWMVVYVSLYKIHALNTHVAVKDASKEIHAKHVSKHVEILHVT